MALRAQTLRRPSAGGAPPMSPELHAPMPSVVEHHSGDMPRHAPTCQTCLLYPGSRFTTKNVATRHIWGTNTIHRVHRFPKPVIF